MYWGQEGSAGTHRPEGYRWHNGYWGLFRGVGVLGHYGASGCIGLRGSVGTQGPEGV